MKFNKKIALFVAAALCISQLLNVTAYTDPTSNDKTDAVENTEPRIKLYENTSQGSNEFTVGPYNKLNNGSELSVCIVDHMYGFKSLEENAEKEDAIKQLSDNKAFKISYGTMKISDNNSSEITKELFATSEQITIQKDYMDKSFFEISLPTDFEVSQKDTAYTITVEAKINLTDKDYSTKSIYKIVVDNERPKIKVVNKSLNSEITPFTDTENSIVKADDDTIEITFSDNNAIEAGRVEYTNARGKLRTINYSDKSENEAGTEAKPIVIKASDLAEGCTYLTVYAKDYAGNTQADTALQYVVRKETIAADYRITNLPKLTNGPFTANVKILNTANTSEINFYIGNSETSSLTLTPYNTEGELYVDVPQGHYTIKVVKTSPSGKKEVLPSNYGFTVDTTKPVVKINSGMVNSEGFTSMSYSPSCTLATGEFMDNDTLSYFLVDGQRVEVSNAIFTEEKTYTITAVATDAAGNVGESSPFTFTIDKTMPVAKIDGLINNFYYNKAVAPIATITDKYLKSQTITLNNKAFVNGTEIKAEGEHQLSASGEDKAGNKSNSLTYVFNIDKTKPTITISGVVNNSIIRNFLKPIIDISENNSLVSMLLNGKEYHGELITEDGKYTLVIKAVDKSGNISEQIITFVLDTTPPKISVSGVENGKYYKDKVEPKVKTYEDADIVMSLNGEPYKGDAIKKPGKYVLIIKATDKAGNVQEEIIEFTILEDGQQAPKGLEGNPKDGTTPSFLATYKGPLIAGASVGVIAIFSIVIAVAVKKRR